MPSSIKGCHPSIFIFHQRVSSFWSCRPQNIFPHQEGPDIETLKGKVYRVKNDEDVYQLKYLYSYSACNMSTLYLFKRRVWCRRFENIMILRRWPQILFLSCQQAIYQTSFDILETNWQSLKCSRIVSFISRNWFPKAVF